jgi:curved DNA-binding protein CbpA
VTGVLRWGQAVRVTNMNHYEELGVGCDAPTEEIRQAYKTLVRLLHPDGQTDGKLKAMAERQMQRLNGILEVLTDPQRRREYDEGLPGWRAAAVGAEVVTLRDGGRGTGRAFPRKSAGGPPSSPEPVAWRGAEWVQAAARYWFWVLVGTAFAATVAVWWAMSPGRSVTEAPPVRAAVQAPVQEGAVPQDEPKRNRGVPAKERAREELDPPRTLAERPFTERPRSPAARNQGTEPAFPDAVTAAGVKLQAAEPREEAVEARPVEFKARADAKSEEPRFAGNWLYTPQAGETTDPGAYPAVYAELLLAEENGDLVGRYRAKYKVGDKPISPEVVLRIRARAPLGKQVRAEWSSGNGAKGVLEMTLRRPGLMSVAWWTTEFGRQQQLTSGGAVLVLQQSQ